MDFNDTPSRPRRLVVGGLATGLLAAATASARALQPVSPSSTGQNASRSQDNGTLTLRDPREGYPKPPFERQSQEWPRLAGEMTPRPDHGETSYHGSDKLRGRKALITGGDSGIGRAVAIAFAREGADVAINYLPAEEPDAREVIALIEEAGRKAIALPGDIRDEGFCGKLVADTIGALGGLDLIVNNAARQHFMDNLADLTTDLFDWTFKTNVYAPFWITRAALPHLEPGAAIIITASVQAYNPSGGLFDYAQTKACNVAFAKSLAKQLGPKGIRVNAVAPGPFWTPLQVSGGQTQSNLESFGAGTPLGRPGQPAEIASVYVELASADATYVTGQVYGAAGGTGNP
ncbi:SDR family oxidoreductase [Rhodoligotrophos ferricapiens]|uniref:SDR family oxidoreductase n=1 Tax=Rhodoligotrophos ferricapiens TaxID=3069264 RepID=UPI00315CE9D0